MEKNTVCLSLDDYQELREFRENILKGNTFTTIGYQCTPEKIWYTKDEVVKELSDKVNGLEEKLLKEEWKHLIKLREHWLKNIEIKEKEGFRKGKYEACEEIKKMSILQFIKWRKSK